MSFKEFSRGDVQYTGGTLAQLTEGKVHFTNGSGLIKTLTGGVDGFHKGTKEGGCTWTQAVLRAGMTENFDEVVDKQIPITVTAVVSLALRYQIEGIMQGIDYSFSEAGVMSGAMGVLGRPTRIKI